MKMLQGLARPAIAQAVEQKSCGKCKRQRRQTCTYQRYTISQVNLMVTYTHMFDTSQFCVQDSMIHFMCDS